MPIQKRYKTKGKGNPTLFENGERVPIWQKLLPLPWSVWPAEARLLITLIAFWSLAGLFILGSASWWVASREMGDGTYYIKRQLLWLITSWSLLYIIISTNLRRWLKLAGPSLFISIILLIATYFVGTTINGSTRWLLIGPIQIQPSELMKPFLILQAANLFAQWKRLNRDQQFFWLSIFGSLLLLILIQPNLSTAALIGILLWLIALAAGIRFRSLFGVAFIGGILGTTSILFKEYQRIRVISFLDPWQDPQGTGYQLVQSLLAIGSGGWFGEGYGLSTQKLQYLPFRSTDFIFAVFAEEFGFLGSMMLLLFLMLIAFLGLRVALRCNTNQTKLVAMGCSTILVGQSLMNIAVASGVMPTTGLPLPMISYGGSSLLSSLLIGGLLIRCSIESTGLIGGPNLKKKLK
ncbi:putative peptidoglycan glycosyltransferase FtsW [Prochlorococcus sp. MIT 1307]|uniref:FtsW/RodA/SpoVE family cell cycle protein n=1 Tax=Prochlorococcus sp. MIT 1307 TaxID=3096219 RepID=UPI002A7665B7|nr:putative peptidoglycan glycosyltransferase FtsW [Prochlorococcus sp. MIT 1307]